MNIINWNSFQNEHLAEDVIYEWDKSWDNVSKIIKPPTRNVSIVEKAFLENNYLQSKYHISPLIQSTIDTTHNELNTKFKGKYVSLCVVWWLVNGSYVIREKKLEKEPRKFLNRFFNGSRVAADIDFYIIVDDASVNELYEMATVVGENFWKIGIATDSTLDGKDKSNALYTSQIDAYIKNDRYDLLSLAFKCCTWEQIYEVQEKIKLKIKQWPNWEKNWKETQFYHNSTLALYHGSFSTDFMNYVQENWLEKKIEIYGI